MSKPKATRQSFGEALAELAEKYTKIVVLDADLSKSTKSEMFAKKFPNRFFEMGIAEANMIGTGAGLALSGHPAFICSFGCFVTGRYDQIRMSIAYSNANVKVIGTHAGIGIGDDGHSQMGLEDLALMRGLPGMTVLQPCDDLETKQMMDFLVQNEGPAYLRLTRQALMPVHSESFRWRLGSVDILHKGVTIKQGQRAIALLGTGATVQECIQAKKILNEKNLDVTIVNISTIKPIQTAEWIDFISQYNEIYTTEDHYTIGGLGSVLSELIAENNIKHLNVFQRLGVQDRFGASGDPAELYEEYGLSAKKIAQAILDYK